jgi:hypothetical protein
VSGPRSRTERRKVELNPMSISVTARTSNLRLLISTCSLVGRDGKPPSPTSFSAKWLARQPCVLSSEKHRSHPHSEQPPVCDPPQTGACRFPGRPGLLALSSAPPRDGNDQFRLLSARRTIARIAEMERLPGGGVAAKSARIHRSPASLARSSPLPYLTTRK